MRIKDNIIVRGDIPDFLVQRGVQVNNFQRNDYRCACPVHGGTNKSSFSCTKSKWYCHACGDGGTIVELFMRLEGCSYMEAIYHLAEMYDIDIESNEEFQKAKSYFDEVEHDIQQYERQQDKVIDYLTQKRNLSQKTIKTLRYGYDNGAIVIPIRNADGMLVAKARRFFNSEPKYKNDKNNDYYEKGETLYGFDIARRIMRKAKKIYLCEGYFDVAAALDQGLPAAGYTGNSLTQRHIQAIAKELTEYDKSFTVMLAADNDEEGQKKVPIMRDKFKQYGPSLNVRVVVMPEGIKDFSELHSNGLSIEGLLTEHIDLYCIKKVLSQCNDIETEYLCAVDFLKGVNNPLIRSEIAEYLAVRWKKDVKDILGIVNGKATDSILLKNLKDPLQAITEFKELITTGTIGCGLQPIDEVTNKFRKSEVVLISAYSSVGKTFFALNQALHTAFREKRNVIFFSMEMSAATLVLRLVAMFLRISEEEAEKRLRENEETAVKVSAGLNKRLYIVDENNLTIGDIRNYINIANTMVFDGQCDMIIVDYLQYMKGVGDFTVLEDTIKSFKSLAKELQIVPVVLCQLNRDGRVWEPVQLNQLKGSGAIESTGDWVFGMWREGLNPAYSMDEQDAKKDIINIGIIKHRRKCVKRDFEFRLDPTTTSFCSV